MVDLPFLVDERLKKWESVIFIDTDDNLKNLSKGLDLRTYFELWGFLIDVDWNFD